MVAVMGADPTGTGTGLDAVGVAPAVVPVPIVDAPPVVEIHPEPGPAAMAADAATPAGNGDDGDDISWLDANRAQQRAAVKASGYRRKRRVYVLGFEDPEYAGLEVKARSVPIGKFMQLMRFAATLDKSGGDMEFDEPTVAAIEGLFDGLAGALVSWNLLDEYDTPVPANRAGIDDQDPEFIFSLLDAWMVAIGGVDAPLGATSTSGAPSPAGSIPMVERSPNPPS